MDHYVAGLVQQQ